MSTDANVSHGRGGAGNINPDDTLYVDGEIRREGDPANSGEAFSAGRGGAGNIGTPTVSAARKSRDDDIVPDAALVAADQTYHSGRGGEGNAVVEGEQVETKKKQDGLLDKFRRRVSGVFGRNK